MQEPPLTGLILSGGGARAAYQMGVLRAIGALRREAGGGTDNPFAIICGTSAGAVNAAALACRADRFDHAVIRIAEVWESLRCEQIYCADAIGVLRTGARWLTMLSVGWVLANWWRAQPRSLLENQPLAGLVKRLVPLERLPDMLASGQLHALAVSASGYTSGEHVTFFQAASKTARYERSQRIAVPAQITHAHLMASSAIPFVFPATHIEHGALSGWYGDGSMRQTSPISPAIHLGAARVLVIGVSHVGEPQAHVVATKGYPTLAQIGGHALSSIFLDGLPIDIERLERINQMLGLLSPEARRQTPLRHVDALVVSPSERIDHIAARHQRCLPRPVRALLRGIGSTSRSGDTRGAALASYLLFEAPFTRELIALGEKDTRERRDEVLAFFDWHAVAAPAARACALTSPPA